MKALPYIRSLKSKGRPRPTLGHLPRGEDMEPDLPLGISSLTWRDFVVGREVLARELGEGFSVSLFPQNSSLTLTPHFRRNLSTFLTRNVNNSGKPTFYLNSGQKVGCNLKSIIKFP